MSKAISIKLGDETYDINLIVGKYPNGSTKVSAVTTDGEPFATVSVCLDEFTAAYLGPGMFYLKDWSENAEIASQLLEQGVIEPDPNNLAVELGFVVARACRLKEAA